jgi:hypothetical protein
MGMYKQQYLGPYIECRRTKKSPHPLDVLENEALHEIHGDDSTKLFFGPNVHRGGSPPDRISDDASCVDLRDIDPKAEMEWFQAAFASEIELLKTAYGKVTIRWGLCQWYS